MLSNKGKPCYPTAVFIRFLKCNGWLFLLLAWLVALLWKVQTYVSGQDPYYYMHLARTLLEEPPGTVAFQKALLKVAPGWPLMLAAVRKVAGPFAPYWLNLVFASLFFCSLVSIIRNCLTAGRSHVVVLYATAIVMFLGYGLNTHFLLYLFRAMPAYALVMLGYWVLVKGGQTIGGCGLAGCLILGAIGMREPMVFALLGAMGWVLTDSQPRRWLRVGSLLLPFVGTITIAVWWLGQGLSAQAVRVASWFDVSFSALWGRIQHAGSAQMVMLLDELTWIGVALLMVGVVVGRRNRSLWCFFAVPALGLLLFYSFLLPHRRYVLSVVTFLGPIVGFGLASLVDLGKGRNQEHSRDSHGSWINMLHGHRQTVASVLLCLPLVWHLARVEPWGPSVSRADVVDFVTDLHQVVPAGDAIVLEHACRYAADAALSFADVSQLINVKSVKKWLKTGRAAYYLRPTGESAFYRRSSRVHPRINLYGDLKSIFNLTQVSGAPELGVAGGNFVVHRITPWHRHLVQNSVHVEEGQPAAVWLDLGAGDEDVAKRIRLLSGSGMLLKEWDAPKTQGFVILSLSEAMTPSATLYVELESDTVLPDSFADHVLLPGHASEFKSGHGMSMSVRRWFAPDVSLRLVDDRSIALFATELRFYPPPLLGPSGTWKVRLQCSTTESLTTPFVITNDVHGLPPQTVQVIPGPARFWNSFVVPLSNSEDTPPVYIRAVVPQGLIRIHAVRFYWDQPVSDS